MHINSFCSKIFYIHGTENVLADSLSRLEGPIPRYSDTDNIEESCKVQVINSDMLNHDDLKYDDGLEDIPTEVSNIDPKFKIAVKQIRN